jgi:hypothetical protein
MLISEAQIEANKLIKLIQEFWGNKVTNINITNITDSPFDMFTLKLKLYGKFNIVMEYEQSTFGIYIQLDNETIGLSKLTKETVLRGFDSYRSKENILYNFKVLNSVIRTM